MRRLCDINGQIQSPSWPAFYLRYAAIIRDTKLEGKNAGKVKCRHSTPVGVVAIVMGHLDVFIQIEIVCCVVVLFCHWTPSKRAINWRPLSHRETEISQGERQSVGGVWQTELQSMTRTRTRTENLCSRATAALRHLTLTHRSFTFAWLVAVDTTH